MIKSEPSDSQNQPTANGELDPSSYARSMRHEGGGVKLPTTHLVDPHAALRGIRRGKRMLPVLLWREKRLRKKLAGRAAPPPVLRPAQTPMDSGI